MGEPTCPRCGSSRAYREVKRVRCQRPDGTFATQDGWWKLTHAGWYVCKEPACWYRWDGITDSGDGVLPAGVVARGKMTIRVIGEETE